MTGVKGRTGIPRWKADLKECEMSLRRTLREGHPGRHYEELSKRNYKLHTYWERNGGLLADLISKAPRLVLQNFVQQRKSVLTFVGWWPIEFGDISVPLLQTRLLRLELMEEDKERLADIEEIMDMLWRKEHTNAKRPASNIRYAFLDEKGSGKHNDLLIGNIKVDRIGHCG